MSLSGSQPWLTVTSPWDGRVLGTVAVTAPSELDEIVNRARQAQRRWQQVPLATRSRIFRRFADLVLNKCDHILDTIQTESGKSRLSAFEEVMDTARGLRVFANLAPKTLGSSRYPGVIPVLTKAVVHHQPVGVVGIITPWNYPFTLPATDAAAALLAGNAVILKPDSQSPLSAQLLAELFTEAGLPDGLFTVAAGRGAVLGPPLVDKVDFVMFTGSTATGRRLATACAQRLIGFSAELGGKNPVLILPDANLEAAAIGTARSAFANTGQLCVSMERAYVHTDIYDDFVPRLVAATRGLRVGVGHDWNIDVGSLISAAQLETVSHHVEDALAKGATALTGAKPRPDIGPFCYEPTILTGVEESMTVCAEETFGPVLSIYRVDSVAEAIAAANDSRYGLNASIWSQRQGWAVAKQLHTGTVNINDGYAPSFGSHHTPMGGMGESGIGRRHGAAGLLKYTEAQTVAHQRLLPIAPPPGVSNEAFARAMTVGIRVLNKLVR